MPRAWILAAALVAAVGGSGREVWRAPAAHAAPAEGEPVQEARRLTKEAQKFFNTAGDTDLPHAERKAARKEAYTRLKEARRLLDEWLDGHPEDTERLDDLYVQIAGMTYWIKKESSIGELTGTAPISSGGSSGGGTGGIGGTSSGGTAKPPASGGTPDPASVDQPVVPEEPEGPTPAEDLAKVEEYQRAHPGDVPGLHDLYTDFLGAHPDPGTPEYARAVAQLDTLGRRLKDVYRTLRDDDPDALEDMDDAKMRALVAQLTQDLASDDETVRARAAGLLGSLGSSLAADPLLEIVAANTGGPVFDAAVGSLQRIGGRRTCLRLARMKGDDGLAQTVALVLGGITERGGPEGRIAGEALASYVLERDADLQAAAIQKLAATGKAGALGLAMLLDVAPDEEKAAYIEQIGAHGEPRTAFYLARFLVVNPRGRRKEQASAARNSIEKLGKPAVRYLIPALDDEDVQVWTAELLRRLTGAKQKNDKRQTWEKWFRRNRRDLED